MTAEEVKAHKEVIEFFLKNPEKGLWYRRFKDPQVNKTWMKTFTPNFYTDNTYLQNDNYSEYRKALCDGKQIQFFNDKNYLYDTSLEANEWHNIDKITISIGFGHYRIKPEYNYPLYMKSKTVGKVIKFTSLQTGEVVLKGKSCEDVGTVKKYVKHTDIQVWEEYKPKMYKPKDIPKQTCFSHRSMSGSYYIENCNHHHCYDSDGDYTKSYSPIPDVEYYISNRDGSYYFEPENPKFKVGDWVIDTVNCETVKLGKHFNSSGIKPWKPKVGEYVVIKELYTDNSLVIRFTKNMNAEDVEPLESVILLKDK